uniref:Uncharacterized protein n=1 Tax=Magallana gigas TaxID=29159 RepID=A0A8W8MD50_MAGGI
MTLARKDRHDSPVQTALDMDNCSPKILYYCFQNNCDYFDKIEYWSQEANQIKQYNELSQQLAQIKNILKMETKNLTAYLNTKKSVSDKRPSARATGYVGGVILGIILCCLVLLDILRCSY